MLYIRPSDQFELSDSPIDWRNIDLRYEADDDLSLSLCTTSNPRATVKYLMLSCKRKSDKSKRFQIKVRGQKVNVLFEDSERLDCDESYIYNIRLLPFLRLKNLLPYPILFSYDPVEQEIAKLESGEEAILPYAIFGQTSM